MADGANPFAEFDPSPPTPIGRGQSAPTRAVPQITGPVDNQGRPLLPLVRSLEGSADDAVSKPQGAGHGGAVGRYQITPATARAYGFDPAKLTDPEYNTAVATTILTDLNQKYRGDTDAILIGFNSTPQHVAKFLASDRDPSTLMPETQGYLDNAHRILGVGAHNPFAQFDAPTSAPVNPFAQFDPGQTANPFAQFDTAPAKPGGTGGFGDALNRLKNALVSGGEKVAGNVVGGVGGLLDVAGQAMAKQEAETGVFPAGETGIPLTAAERAQAAQVAANQTPIISPATRPIAQDLYSKAQAAMPTNPSLLEKVGEGAGEFGGILATGAVAPEAVPALFAAQGYEEQHQGALAAGKTEAQAQAAGLEGAGVQGGLGALPVGEIAAPFVKGLSGVAGVAARIGVEGAGNAAINAGMTAGSNVVAEQYDPARTWSEGVPQAAFVGGLTGAAMHGVSEGFGAAKNAIGARLRARADVAPGAPAAMPATTALQDYIGPSQADYDAMTAGAPPQPAAPSAPDQFAAKLARGQSATTGGFSYRVAPHPARPGQFTIDIGQPGSLVQSFGFGDGWTQEEAVAQARKIAFPDETVAPENVPGNFPETSRDVRGAGPSTWTPEREAAFQAAYNPPSEPPASVPQAAHDMLEGLHPSTVAQAAADVDEWKAAAPRGYSLFQAIKDLGGIATKDENGVAYGGADVAAALSDVRRPGLINNKSGMPPEYMMQALSDQGWFGPGGSDDPTEFESMLDREAHNTKVYHPEADTGAQLARRDMLDSDMALAGVTRRDDPALAAAKLARYRQDAMDASSPEGQALEMRAEELGVPHETVKPQDELLADVLEREAIQGEAGHDDANAYERSINLQLTGSDREHLEALAREGLGPEHAESGAARPLPAGWEFEPPTPEGYSESAAGAARLGEDSGASPAIGQAELGRSSSGRPAASWVVVDRETGKPVLETFERKTADRINQDRYEVLPAEDWLARHNRAIRENGGVEPESGSPTTERVRLASETVDQGVIPGAEQSARQAAAARSGPLRGRGPQQDPGGLFAPPEPHQEGLFDARQNPFSDFDPHRDPNAPKFQRAGSPVFYSAAERVVDQSHMKAAPAEQWKATLRNAAGVKREELEWSGVMDWLDLFGKDEKVPKEKVAAFLRDNGVKVEERILGVDTDRAIAAVTRRLVEGGMDPADAHAEAQAQVLTQPGTQYEDWKEPGGENYRELLLTLPKEANPPATHWDTPGVMAHVRFDERTAPDGKKVLFVQEIQSDWHQKGRDQGYAQKANPAIVSAARARADEATAKWATAVNEWLPSVAALAERRLADAEAQRYALAKQVTSAAAPDLRTLERAHLAAADNVNRMKNLLATVREPRANTESRVLAADNILQSRELWGGPGDPLSAERKVVRAQRDALTELHLRRRETAMDLKQKSGLGGIPDAPFKSSWPALVMKRVIRWAVENGADRVAWTTGEQQGERYSLENDDGMRAFYDRNLVNITNDLIKRFGAKVGDTRIVDPGHEELLARYAAQADRERSDMARRASVDPDWRTNRPALAEISDRLINQEAEVRARGNEGQRQHGFEITDKMREAAMGGFPLFNRPTAGPRVHPLVDAVRAESPTARQQALIDHVDDLLHKLAPFAESHPFQSLTERSSGDPLHGMSYRDGLRRIVGWSLEGPDAIHTARHEAVHALRSAGVITDEEWSTLASAALSDGWMDRHNIESRYPHDTKEQQIEEAIAEQFASWRRGSFSNLPPAIATVFKRIQAVLQQLGDGIRRVFGRAATADDVLSRMESGEVGARQLGSARENGVRFQREAEETPYEKPRGIITRMLGHGAESVGRKLVAKADLAIPDPVSELIDAAKMGVNPMGMGSERAQATAKDFANATRLAAFQWGKVDEWLAKTFTPEQRRRMWTAADEHGVILRQGREPGPDEGKNTLSPEERGAVEEIQSRADKAFAMAQDLGMVQGDGLESYVPRMVVEMTVAGPKVVSKATPKQAKRGANLSTTTGQLRQRKYETVEETEAAAKKAFGAGAEVVRDIRTLALGTQRLEQAIAGRTLVNKIKAMSADAGGGPLVSEGTNPGGDAYFTIEHPALQKWGPKMIVDEAGKHTPAIDQNGDMVFEAHPLYISSEFEGPLKAVLSTPSGKIVRALMDLKGKMMSVIMYSPLMHNAVIWGKAIPADPKGVLTFGAYRRGNAAKKDPAVMREAISAGLDPIGHRFFNQDITGIAAAEGQDIVPGRSWTAQMLSYIPSLFDKEAGNEVKRFVDKFGDLWHNTFLWDRIADLQMGLYTHMRDKMIAGGEDPLNAQRVAAHFANRYAGTLPIEGMSKLARTTANMVLFSRSFTLGNAAIFKDVVMGLPSDVRAQVLRDSGRAGLDNIQGVARQKATGMLALDLTLSYAGLALAAGATAWLTGQKFQGPWANEPGKEKRFLIGYQPDGTAIYGRLPTGKVGEELFDWPTDFRDTLLRKLSPYGRLMYAMAANDKGFGQKMFDPYDHTPAGFAKNIGRVMLFAMGGIAPESQLQAAHDMATGATDRKTAALATFGPMLGLTISKGAPGGPAMADLYAVRDEQNFKFSEQRADIARMIKAGDVVGARAKMTAIGVSPALQRYMVKVAQNPSLRMSPRAVKDFLLAASPEERARFEADRAAGQQRLEQSNTAP